MYHYTSHIPQQKNNFQQNNHTQNDDKPYMPENPLLTNPVGSGDFFIAIEQALPPVFSRKKAAEVLGGLISAKTLSNLDALRVGPPRIRNGSKVGYDRASFMLWLRGRITSHR